MKLLSLRVFDKRLSNRGGVSLLLTAVFAIWAINKGEGWRHDDDADLRFFALGDGSDERTWNRKFHEGHFHDEPSSLLLPLLLLGSCLALVLGCVLRRVFFQRNGTTKKNNPETRVKAAARPLAATALLGLLCVIVAPTTMAVAMPADGSDIAPARGAFTKIRRMEQLAGGLPEAGVSLPLAARGSRSELATLGAKEHAAAADFDAASALERICHRFVEGRSSAEVSEEEKNARTETPPLPLRTSPTRRRKDGAKRPVSGGAEDDEAPEAPWAKWVPNRSDRRRLSTLNVYNESDLQAALSDSTVTYITLTADIYLGQVGSYTALFITDSVTIDGGDGQRTLGFTSSDSGNGRVFQINSGTLTLRNLQLVNGYDYSASGVASVSAIDCFLVVLGCISHALPS